jgi:ribosomal protein S18 acetylase RimI-like enzyme
MIELQFGTGHLDWDEVCLVIERAPLGKREPDKLRKAAENSYLVCSAHKDGSVIGFGRALSDGVYQSAIYDVVVLPEYQGQGVGKKIMQELLSRLPQGLGPVLIYVAPGKEGFYKKLGFEPLLTGMGLFWLPGEARKKGLIP